MASFRLTPRALADLDQIAEYTISRWGRAQAERYLTRLADRLAALATAPDLGRPRDDIARGYRCFPEGQHLIFYRQEPQEITILGVPHQSMDLGKGLR